MSEVKKVLFIVNKYSGTRYQPRLEGKIISTCQKNNVECAIEFTNGPGHATELAKGGVLQKFDAVVAVGGDGTVNEVAQGLVHSSVPMGILPKGSGNGLARHLGISRRISIALKQLLTGKEISMDTFLLNGKLSVNVSGVGFDGHIANLFSAGTKRGLRGYAKLISREYFRFKEFEFDATLNTHAAHRGKAFMIAIANSSQYGNNARVAPHASVTDQTLQLVLLKKIPLYRGLVFGIRMFTKKLKPGKRYQSFSFQNGVLKSKYPMSYHVDGEASGTATEFTVELQPRSLHMIVPAKKINKV